MFTGLIRTKRVWALSACVLGIGLIVSMLATPSVGLELWRAVGVQTKGPILSFVNELTLFAGVSLVCVGVAGLLGTVPPLCLAFQSMTLLAVYLSDAFQGPETVVLLGLVNLLGAAVIYMWTHNVGMTYFPGLMGLIALVLYVMGWQVQAWTGGGIGYENLPNTLLRISTMMLIPPTIIVLLSPKRLARLKREFT